MYFLVVRRYAPFATFGGGFEGDSRSAGTVNPFASARTIGVAAFTLGNVTGYEGWSSGSTFDGAGDWIRKIIGRHFSHVKADVSGTVNGRAVIAFTMHTAGANPLIPIVAPDIVTYVDFKATYNATSVVFEGVVRGDTFPNCEVFVLDVKGNGEMLFDYRTAGGQNTGPLRLIGRGNSSLGTFNDTVAVNDEIFVAPQPTCMPTKGS
jgi:hypothetical protein